MTSRVLIADDSLTIQKVIGITLANSGYELIECTNEEDLLNKVKSNHFDLILLDFNLSDTHSGYDLSKQVFNINPNAAIIVMLGTFDSIDESQFPSCGISDKIVKPFESSKFIKKCRDLLEGLKTKPVAISEEKLQIQSVPQTIAPDTNNDDLDLWTVDAPQMTSKSTSEESALDSFDSFDSQKNKKQLDPLSSEIEGWGFAANTNLEEKFNKTFPPAIEDPSTDQILDRLQSSSTFVASKFAVEDDELTDPSYELLPELNRELLTEIEEEISPDAFWAVDEVVPVKSEEYKDIVDTNLDEVTADLTEAVLSFKAEAEVAAPKVTKNEKSSKAIAPVEQKSVNHSDSIVHMDQDELIEKLKISLRPMIEEMVREFCRQNAEKVAWEIIPDLAENLIRKEIKEISDSIKH